MFKQLLLIVYLKQADNLYLNFNFFRNYMSHKLVKLNRAHYILLSLAVLGSENLNFSPQSAIPQVNYTFLSTLSQVTANGYFSKSATASLQSKIRIVKSATAIPQVQFYEVRNRNSESVYFASPQL